MEGLDFKYAFSHVLVSGMTVWCIYHTKRCDGFQWIFLSYGIILIYSLIGVWRYGNPLYGHRSIHLYEFLNAFQTCTTLPLAVYELYIHYGYKWQSSLLHVTVPVLPLLNYLTSTKYDKDLLDIGIIGNIISLFILSTIQQNYFGITAALSYTVNHFVLKVYEFRDTPRKLIFNIGVCYHLYFMYKALNEAHIKCF